ncbi:MAG: hypothetical protein K0R83_762 [Caulobacter sp.]|jgi:hypothetical protein|nr:hypothetical protein [Caulobacter sp.]
MPPSIAQVLRAIDREAWELTLRAELRALRAGDHPIDPRVNYPRMRADLSADEARAQLEAHAVLTEARRRFYGLNPRTALIHLNLLRVFANRNWLSAAPADPARPPKGWASG